MASASFNEVYPDRGNNKDHNIYSDSGAKACGMNEVKLAPLQCRIQSIQRIGQEAQKVLSELEDRLEIIAPSVENVPTVDTPRDQTTCELDSRLYDIESDGFSIIRRLNSLISRLKI